MDGKKEGRKEGRKKRRKEGKKEGRKRWPTFVVLSGPAFRGSFEIGTSIMLVRKVSSKGEKKEGKRRKYILQVCVYHMYVNIDVHVNKQTCLCINCSHTRTHTHTHIYIYIYIHT